MLTVPIREQQQALTLLQGLHIVSIDSEANSRSYRLQPTFAKSLRQALTGGGNHKSFGVPCTTPDQDKKSISWLDDHARSRWEAILYYMVASTGTSAGIRIGYEIAQGTKALLRSGGFIKNSGSITQTGFTFLLQEVNAQVWSLLVVYLSNAKDLAMEPVEVLSFLFMLGSLELGQDYSTANLTPTQKHMLDDLSDFGIVYRSPSDPSRFYPTRLATTLTSDAGALANTSLATSSLTPSANAVQGSKGYIIIETNYRLYAYTSSLLQIAVLALFAKLHTRYPNLVAGKLTKVSVQRAIEYGITAQQIIDYLRVHAHPQMLKNDPVLPPTVTDQIALWQREGDRMATHPGYLLKEFASRADYDDAAEYAKALGVLQWKNDHKQMFFVTKIEQMQTYMRNKGNQDRQRKEARKV